MSAGASGPPLVSPIDTLVSGAGLLRPFEHPQLIQISWHRGCQEAKGKLTGLTGVPALTRRRMQDVHQVTWLIFYDDIRVGTIAERSGVPLDLDRWGWSLGFFPKSERPGEIRGGYRGDI